MSDLSVMILCGRSPRHLYVANRLSGGARVLAIVQETGSELDARRLVRKLHPANLWRKGWRWLRDRRRYAGDREARFFFGERPPVLEHKELRIEVPHINHPQVAALADRLQPDVVAVFGTSLIHGALLERGRLGIFNLHGGLSPRYRGADCTFWALYNGEPDQVGCTLHRIDAGIDTGALVAHIRPEVREGDDELTLFWRGIRDSAEVFVQMLDRLERGERLGQPQTEKGRLYQVRQRRWRDERSLAARLARGLLHGVHLPSRVSWFVTQNVSSRPYEAAEERESS
jgi:methionyl-tRNA formyltransferase